MSQKKVDQYKEYKKNRSQIIAKQKRSQKIEVAIAALIAVLFIGWFGYSIYNSATRPAETEEGAVTATEIDFNEYQEYLSSLELNY